MVPVGGMMVTVIMVTTMGGMTVTVIMMTTMGGMMVTVIMMTTMGGMTVTVIMTAWTTTAAWATMITMGTSMIITEMIATAAAILTMKCLRHIMMCPPWYRVYLLCPVIT